MRAAKTSQTFTSAPLICPHGTSRIDLLLNGGIKSRNRPNLPEQKWLLHFSLIYFEHPTLERTPRTYSFGTSGTPQTLDLWKDFSSSHLWHLNETFCSLLLEIGIQNNDFLCEFYIWIQDCYFKAKKIILFWNVVVDRICSCNSWFKEKSGLTLRTQFAHSSDYTVKVLRNVIMGFTIFT